MSKTGAVLWLAIVCASAVFVLFRGFSGLPLETNFLALLPGQSETAWVREAKARVADKVAKRVVIAIAHEDFATAKESLHEVLSALTSGALIQEEGEDLVEGLTSLGALFFPYRTGLLSQADRAQLLEGQGDKIAQTARAQILSPFSMVDGAAIPQDPFLIFPRFLAALPGDSSKLKQKDEVLTISVEGLHYVVATRLLTGEPFAQDFQARFVPRLADLERGLQDRYPTIRLLKTGAIFYAEESIRNGQKEATLLGGLSLAGIVLVLLFVFRSLQPIMLSLLAIAAGLACGMAASLIIFERVHLMALVFGAGLIGISVDYSIHYCCERLSPDALEPRRRLQAILPGLTLGMISSVIGFLTLALAPFPGLRQIAVFSAVGLLASYITVVLLFPILDKSPQLNSRVWIPSLGKLRSVLKELALKINGIALLLIVLAGAGAGLYLVTPDDDVRKLQTLPAGLKAQEAEIRDLSGVDTAAQFFIVSGATTEAVLQAEEKLVAALEGLVAKGTLSGYNAIARLVPSQNRQEVNRKLLSEKLLIPHLSSYLERIGGRAEFGYSDGLPGFLTPQLVSENGGAAFLNLLTLQGAGQEILHLVTLSGVKDISALADAGAKLKAVRLIDQGQEWSAVLATYRVRALSLLAAAIVLIWGFLSFRYRLAPAARVVASPVVAVVFTPLIIAIFGGSFTFFNAMALILVFVIGLDYALFFAESSEDHRNISFFANGLSALSTIFAFGLMSFSEVYAVHAFGITILTGILLAFTLTPLAVRRT